MDLMKPIVQGKVLMIDAGSSVDMRFWDASNERLYISGVPITPAGKTDVCIDLSACNSPPLYIAKTPGGKGYGLYSCVYLPKGSIIGAYCGEVIRSDECSKRQRDVYDPTGQNYVLTVREVHPTTGDVITTNVDATCKGGFARYINHSCDPNCVVEMHRLQHTVHIAPINNNMDSFTSNCRVTVHPTGGSAPPTDADIEVIISRVSRVVGIPIIMALRSILPGDEITFDYGSNSAEASALKRPRLLCNIIDDASHSGASSIVTRPCLCGSSNCRGYLPYSI